MHDTLPKYRIPGRSPDEPIPDFRMWEAACAHYERKQYREALVKTLQHVNPVLLSALDSSGDPVALDVPHGSARVFLTIDSGRFCIRAPFLRVGAAHRIPLMRRVAEVNFRPLTLATIVLQGDVLAFEYETPVEMCQPHKIMGVLQETCFFADKYDDEFIKKYNASNFREPDVRNLTDAENQAIWDHLTELSSEYNGYLAYFEKKNWDRLTWDIITMSMLHIASIPSVQGTLRWELSERIQEMYDTEIQPAERLDKGKRFLNDFYARLDRRETLLEFYHVRALLSMKESASIPRLQQECQRHRDRIYGEINSGNVYAAAFSLQHFFSRVIYDYSLHEDHYQLICSALERTGGTAPGNAIAILRELFDGFLNGSPTLPGPAPKKKGFFSRIFE